MSHSQTPPKVIKKDVHNIKSDQILTSALKVIDVLQRHDHEAYLVGGSVRDLLLDHQPKDFDVATSASPEEVHKLFRNSRLIGRRFKLVHVRFGREIIEVATFRAAAPEDTDSHHHQQNDDGRVLRDNVYGTLVDDAWRRDFTINALYFDPKQNIVLDHVGGCDDLKTSLVRLIGDPDKRFREDPVRMIRAIRFSTKLDFKIERHVEEKILELGHLLLGIPPARMFDEVLKLFHTGNAVAIFQRLQEYDVLRYLFPQTAEILDEGNETATQLILAGLKSTDQRISQRKPVTPAFLYACLLWPALQDSMRSHKASIFEAIIKATEKVMRRQCQHVLVPRRFSIAMREIWSLQPRLERRQGRRALRLLSHPRFRAAYDFLLLRQQAGEDLHELCDWWTRFQAVDEEEQSSMLKALKPEHKGKRGRRRRPKPND